MVVFTRTDHNIGSDQIHSIEELEATIEAIHGVKISHGCPDIKINKNNKSDLNSFTYSDNMNIVRHKNCLLILKDDELNGHQCNCKSVMQRLKYENNSQATKQKTKILKGGALFTTPKNVETSEIFSQVQ